MPKIGKFMTPMPHTIEKDLPVPEAMNLMRIHHIRHLPVVDAGKIVGMITDRDIKFASGFGDVSSMKVDDVMSPEPYTVSPETTLDLVVGAMAVNKLSSAVVLDSRGEVVGIFTSNDGFRVMGEILHQNYAA